MENVFQGNGGEVATQQKSPSTADRILQELITNPYSVAGDAKEFFGDVAQDVGKQATNFVQNLVELGSETTKLIRDGWLPATSIENGSERTPAADKNADSRSARTAENRSESTAENRSESTAENRSERLDNAIPKSSERGTESAERALESAEKLESWNKMLEDSGLKDGPYKDLMTEFGKQLIDGKFDSQKLQDLMKKAKESDADHFAAWKSIMELNKKLKESGIVVDMEPSAWSIRVAEPVQKGEWTVSMSLDADGKMTTSKRRFTNPDAPFPQSLANDKEDITQADAFKHLSSKFRATLK